MANILILEDDIALSGYWQDLLENQDHQVICCINVPQALEQLFANDFGLIIADMMIKQQASNQFEPQGGLTLLAQRQLGALSPAPILGVSGYKPSTLDPISPLRIAKAQGADLILYKPISAETFLNAVNTLLGNNLGPDAPVC